MLLKLLRGSELGMWYRLYTSKKSSFFVKKCVLISIGLKLFYFYLLTKNPYYQKNNMILYY
jgi:hypothetical protein